MSQTTLKNEEKAVFALRSLYQRYGYAPYKMSRFEEYDLYVRNKDFLISDQIITFSDANGRLLALKPDVTLSIVKNAPDTPGVVQKVYYNENVYRDYREIMQAGLECVGDLGGYEIAEVVMLAARSLELLGGKYVLCISHMGLIRAVLDSCALSGEDEACALDCLRRKNPYDLKALLGEQSDAYAKLCTLITCRGEAQKALDALETRLSSTEEKRALGELRELFDILGDSGCGDGLRLDFSVSNDMRYYSGVVFRGYLEGVPASVLSGGQYDRLPEKMGRRSRAIGFAIYLNLLQGLQGSEGGFDVDTLIVHDEKADVAALMRVAEEASKLGSVLVAKTPPKDRSFKRLMRFENGEAVVVEAYD